MSYVYSVSDILARHSNTTKVECDEQSPEEVQLNVREKAELEAEQEIKELDFIQY